ncbi:MAG: class I SAM-dependent methyltransferase [Salinibacter sp.]
MPCCDHCEETGELFDRTKAKTELRKYRKSEPPNKSTRLLINALKTLDLQDKTLLDVGGGVGMIPHELLDAGVAQSTLVEASSAYLEVAENESQRRGHADRTAFKHGDFVELAPNLPDADLVTLDRVICCYPHLDRLVQASTDKATRWYGVTYPKEAWYNKMLKGLTDIYCWIRDMDFRMYIHSKVEETIRSAGFTPFYQVNTILWRVSLYERDEGRTNEARSK